MKSLPYYIEAVKFRTANYIYKRHGWITNRKIVVFESDDWGSVRMPSSNTLKILLEKGVNLNPELGYDRYDTLASSNDISSLIDVLSSTKDGKGNPAKITLNYLMTNPDFKKIKESNFTEYHYELFTETLSRYSKDHDKTFSLVKEGIIGRLFMPQFHGREHLNVQMWLSALQKDYPGVRKAFEYEVFCNYIDKKFDKRYRFLDAFNISSKNEYDFVLKSIREGLNLFEKVFGFRSVSMIAPNYTWDMNLEKTIHEEGVKILQGGIFQKFSLYAKNKTRKNGKFHYMGESNDIGQIYLIRNCFFEPTQSPIYGYKRCLKDIDTAFRLKKPAIISSHRLNFIGSLDTENRNNNLKQLNSLLSEIVRLWPDVEFMSSDELGSLILKSNDINEKIFI